MAKILMVVDNEFDNDIRVVREVNILKAEGHSISILCYGFQKKYLNTIEDINVLRIETTRRVANIFKSLTNRIFLFNNLWIKNIVNTLNSEEFDFILAHDLYMSYPVYKAIKKSNSRAKFYLDLHENYPVAINTYNFTKVWWKNILIAPNKWIKKESQYLQFPDKIIVLSNHFKFILEERYPTIRGKIKVLPNVPDLRRFMLFDKTHIAAELSFHKPLMFYFGGVAERRGIFESLECFKELVSQGQKLNYLIVGPVDKADADRFKRHLEDPVLKGRLFYKKWIDISELPHYLNYVDFCIAPFVVNDQHESGIANKIFQYLYGKKAVIASDCKPQADLLNKYNAGIIFKNSTELKDAMIKLSLDSLLANEMGENGHNAIINEFNIDFKKKDFVNLFSV